MGPLKTLSVAALAVTGLASDAFGADMLFPPAMEMAGRPSIVELGTGWYLRGDAAWVDYVTPRDRRSAGPSETFDTTRLDATWSAGGGFGYKFLNGFRSDVTIDYRFASAFAGTSSRSGYAADTRRDWGDLESTTGLVNAYFDLGPWYGVSPYVGVGVGAALNQLLGHNAQVTCIAAPCGAPGPQAALRGRDRSSVEFAWALMGGAAVEIGGGFTIDVGYRYLNLGEVRTSGVGPAAPTRTEDITAHEVRLGLRYMIDQ